jgi:hypothetical protein
VREGREELVGKRCRADGGRAKGGEPFVRGLVGGLFTW